MIIRPTDSDGEPSKKCVLAACIGTGLMCSDCIFDSVKNYKQYLSENNLKKVGDIVIQSVLS